jgi:hypothetical protein
MSIVSNSKSESLDDNANISNEAFTRSDKILNLKELTFQANSIDDDGLQHVTKRILKRRLFE